MAPCLLKSRACRQVLMHYPGNVHDNSQLRRPKIDDYKNSAMDPGSGCKTKIAILENSSKIYTLFSALTLTCVPSSLFAGYFRTNARKSPTSKHLAMRAFISFLRSSRTRPFTFACTPGNVSFPQVCSFTFVMPTGSILHFVLR